MEVQKGALIFSVILAFLGFLQGNLTHRVKQGYRLFSHVELLFRVIPRTLSGDQGHYRNPQLDSWGFDLKQKSVQKRLNQQIQRACFEEIRYVGNGNACE